MFEIIKVTGDGKKLAEMIDATLDAQAFALGHPFNPEQFNFEARDADGKYLGGLSGYAQLGWLFVKLLGLAPEARGHGVGRQLLDHAEAQALAAGFGGVYLDTFEFQAPGFYEKLGYSEFGRLPKLGDQPQRIWFAKILAPR